MPGSLQGKKILLGLTGGIAAYKTLTLIRLLVKGGAEVRCVCTPSALEFVTSLCLETLSGHPVYSDLFSGRNEVKTEHIHYADWADLLVVAPASANTIAKFAHGIADNALTTLFNAFDKTVVMAPAMNTRMFRHPATQANLAQLREWGVRVLAPASGDLACGVQGEGRMPEPEILYAYIEWTCRHLSAASPLGMPQEASFYRGKKVLLTAGPTVEPIAPVRYLSNHSSGLMGCCLSDELSLRGAEVYLVTGPAKVRPRFEPYRLIPVQTAAEMYDAAISLWPDMDIAVLSAAVADYTPAEVSEQKIKKDSGQLSLELKKTQDILAQLGKDKRQGQLLVGFALETENEVANAKSKLERKNADMIVLNSLRNPGAGFAVGTNQVTFIDRQGRIKAQELKSKEEVASDILDYLPSLS